MDGWINWWVDIAGACASKVRSSTSWSHAPSSLLCSSSTWRRCNYKLIIISVAISYIIQPLCEIFVGWRACVRADGSAVALWPCACACACACGRACVRAGGRAGVSVYAWSVYMRHRPCQLSMGWMDRRNGWVWVVCSGST